MRAAKLISANTIKLIEEEMPAIKSENEVLVELRQ